MNIFEIKFLIFRKDNHFYEKIGKKGEAVCIDDEIPFDIPDSWEFANLDNFIYTIPTKKYQIKKSQILKKGNIPVISQSAEYIEGYSNDYNKILEVKNPILIFGDHTKNIKFVDFNFIVGADGVKILKPIILFPQFAFYLLNFSKINMRNRGYSRHFQFLKDIYYPIPPFNEQKRIVKKIQEFLPLIEKYNRLEDKLGKLNQEFPNKIKDSILQYAIQGKLVPQNSDDEPASVLLEKIREEKEQLIKEKKIKRNKKESFIFKENNHFFEKIGNKESVCIDDEIPFEIPESWKWCRLGDLVYNFGQKKPDKTFSYVDVSSIDNKNLKLSNQENILTKDEAPSRARKIIKKDTIIYSTVRPYLLNMCIIDKEFSHEPIASTAFAILNPFTGVYNKYLFYYLQSPTFINYVNNVMSGVAYPAINDKKLYNSLISLPPLEEQKRIVKMIEKLIKNFNKN